jgi:hypothetical protein
MPAPRLPASQLCSKWANLSEPGSSVKFGFRSVRGGDPPAVDARKESFKKHERSGHSPRRLEGLKPRPRLQIVRRPPRENREDPSQQGGPLRHQGGGGIPGEGDRRNPLGRPREHGGLLGLRREVLPIHEPGGLPHIPVGVREDAEGGDQAHEDRRDRPLDHSEGFLLARAQEAADPGRRARFPPRALEDLRLGIGGLAELKNKYRRLLDLIWPCLDEAWEDPFSSVPMAIVGRYGHPEVLAAKPKSRIATAIFAGSFASKAKSEAEAEKAKEYSKTHVSGVPASSPYVAV